MTIIALLTSIPLMFFKEGMYIHVCIYIHIYIHICLYSLLSYLHFYTYLLSFSVYISIYIVPLTKLNLIVNGVIYIREDVYIYSENYFIFNRCSLRGICWYVQEESRPVNQRYPFRYIHVYKHMKMYFLCMYLYLYACGYLCMHFCMYVQEESRPLNQRYPFRYLVSMIDVS
jgi:hypothetical protein